MGIFSLYIIMSNNDEDYLDDPEILDFNETLEAREAAEETDPNEAFRLKMFGPTGKGSPVMGRQSPYELSRNAAQARRNEGFTDDKYLKPPINLEPFNEQQKKRSRR